MEKIEIVIILTKEEAKARFSHVKIKKKYEDISNQ